MSKQASASTQRSLQTAIKGAKPQSYWQLKRQIMANIQRAIEDDMGNEDRMCVHCGCTDSHACPGGCSWVIEHKATMTGVCSNCLGEEQAILERVLSKRK